MKAINFTFKISLIFLTLLSCNNEQLEQENQQEFFEITNLETGEIISVYDIEVKMISDNNSDNLDFLSIKGSTNIDDSFLCVEIFLLLSPEIVGFYTNDEELIMQSTSTCDGGIFAVEANGQNKQNHSAPSAINHIYRVKYYNVK